MKVLEVVGEPILHGGQEKFIDNLYINIDDHNIVMDVLTPYFVDNQVLCEHVEDKGGTVYSLGYKFEPGKGRGHLKEPIKKYIENGKYDIVHIHSGSISFLAYAAIAAKRAGIDRIIVHSHATASPSLKHSIVRSVYGRLIEGNATFFCACSHDAGKDAFPIASKQNKVVVISNGIKLEDYKRNLTKRNMVREALHISSNEYVIGHVGRFSLSKNHRFLVDLFSLVLKRIPEAKLLLIGDGELRDEIEGMTERLGLKDRIIFTGNIDNVADYFQAMDIFLFPSSFEGFGYVALEAQAAGIPCIISDGVPDETMIGRNIIKLQLNEPLIWQKTILEYKDVEPVDNSTAITEAGYDIESTISKVLEIYRS